MKNIIITFLSLIMLTLMLALELMERIICLKKIKPVKDCFESLNRATFALNQGLDKVIFKPVAKGYRAYHHQLELEQVMCLLIFLLL